MAAHLHGNILAQVLVYQTAQGLLLVASLVSKCWRAVACGPLGLGAIVNVDLGHGGFWHERRAGRLSVLQRDDVRVTLVK